MTLLLVLLFVKHFLADFPLQTQGMIAGKGQKHNWLGWLASHCAVHAGFTFAILLFFAHPATAFFLAFVEFYIHLNVDRIKAWNGRHLKPDQKAFWNALGADQLAHALTYIWIASRCSGV